MLGAIVARYRCSPSSRSEPRPSSRLSRPLGAAPPRVPDPREGRRAAPVPPRAPSAGARPWAGFASAEHTYPKIHVRIFSWPGRGPASPRRVDARRRPAPHTAALRHARGGGWVGGWVASGVCRGVSVWACARRCIRVARACARAVIGKICFGTCDGNSGLYHDVFSFRSWLAIEIRTHIRTREHLLMVLAGHPAWHGLVRDRLFVRGSLRTNPTSFPMLI